MDELIPNQLPVRRTIFNNLSSIRNDFKKLASLEVLLARAEFREETRRFAVGMLFFALALGVGVGTTVLLGLSSVELLESFEFSRAAALGIVTAALLVVTGSLLTLAWIYFNSLDFVPRQTLETLKENAQWVQNPMKSETK